VGIVASDKRQAQDFQGYTSEYKAVLLEALTQKHDRSDRDRTTEQQ
jgi:hypothetical protein